MQVLISTYAKLSKDLSLKSLIYNKKSLPFLLQDIPSQQKYTRKV